MDIEQFKSELFQKGTELGFEEMEIYYNSNQSIDINVHQQKLEEYNIAETGGVSFRGLYEGQMGYAYAEKIESDSIPLLIEEALSNAKILEMKDEINLFAGSSSYPPSRAYSDELEQVDANQLIDAAMEMERIAFDQDERVQSVQYCYLTKSIGEVLIANSKGLHCYEKIIHISAGIYLVVNEGESTATGGYSDFALTAFSELDVEEIAKKAVKEAVAKLNAQSIESGRYPVIFREDAATSLLGSYIGLLTAENVQKGYSKFAGKINQQVAGENISFIDDPLMPNVPGNITFDSEGFATKRKEIIKNGQLQTFMHNRKTAKKDGVESTGNAVKSGYRGTLSIGPYNLYVAPGEQTLGDLVGTIDRGLLIVELQGLNAGINVIAGDFSLAAIGFLIEDGKITQTIDQFTVSGNFFDLINQVELIGNDLRIKGSFSSPSIKVKPLLVSGSK